MNLPSDWTLPTYSPCFTVGETLNWAQSVYEEVNAKIQGIIAMTSEDAAILAQAIANAGDGDHLEIGSFWGGSACLAALTKRACGYAGKIVCIDDLEMAGADWILENATRMGVEEMIELHIGKSSPFPFDNNRRFRTALIDGAHDYGNVIADWYNVRIRTDKYAIFHDYDPQHTGVVEAAREAMREWRPVFLAQHTLILEKTS